jgi:hypothetical protein
MANEFKVRNGLIVTGSEYVSESIFAPNLPEETNPAYYITWKQADGEFQISQLSPSNTANTIGCWDSTTNGDPTSGQWRTDNGSVGNTTGQVVINVTDKGSNNQNNTLASLAIGSVITLYVGSFKTSFEITGIKIVYLSPSVPQYYIFDVNYLSGDQYTYINPAEMCLGIAAAAPTNQNCVTYKAVTAFSSIASTTGGGMFINNTGYTLTVDLDVYYFQLNDKDLNGISTSNFFNGVTPGQSITLTSGTNTATFIFNYSSTSGAGNQIVGVQITSNSNFTLSANQSFTICA